MSFVDDCISRNRLLDYQDYQWVPLPETKPVPRGKRKSSGVVPRESEDEDNEDDIPLAKKVKAAKRGPGRPPKPEIQKSAESSHKKPGKTNTDGPPAKPKIEQLKAPLKTPVKFESPQPSTSTKSDARLAPNLYTEEEVKLALEETLHYHSTEDVPVWARLCERLHEQVMASLSPIPQFWKQPKLCLNRCHPILLVHGTHLLAVEDIRKISNMQPREDEFSTGSEKTKKHAWRCRWQTLRAPPPLLTLRVGGSSSRVSMVEMLPRYQSKDPFQLRLPHLGTLKTRPRSNEILIGLFSSSPSRKATLSMTRPLNSQPWQQMLSLYFSYQISH